MEVKIGVSNRHVHLTKEIYDQLFDEPLEVDKPLNQKGEFASKSRVMLLANGYEIANVRVLGPLRKYNQVEISHNDALKFKIDPPVRASGDVENGAEITLKTSKGEVTLNSCILAQRHVHMNYEDAQKYHVTNGELVQIKIDGPRSGIMDAYIKISENGFYEAHIDTDDANAFLIGKDAQGTLIINKNK